MPSLLDPEPKWCLFSARLRVVSNFGDGDCGADEIHTHEFRGDATRIPWVPEAFLARFPVAAYVLYCDSRQAARCVGLRSRRLDLRPISPDVSEKKTSGTQGTTRRERRKLDSSNFRARVYFARPTIAIAKIRDYSQSIFGRFPYFNRAQEIRD